MSQELNNCRINLERTLDFVLWKFKFDILKEKIKVKAVIFKENTNSLFIET